MSQIIQKVNNIEFVNFLNYTCKLFSNDDISYYLLYVIDKMTIIRGIPQENVDCYVELFSLSCFQSNKKIVKIATEFLHKKEIESMMIMIKLLPKAVNTNNCDFVNSIVPLVSSQSDDKELIWNALLDSTFEYFSPLKNKDVVGI